MTVLSDLDFYGLNGLNAVFKKLVLQQTFFQSNAAIVNLAFWVINKV